MTDTQHDDAAASVTMALRMEVPLALTIRTHTAILFTEEYAGGISLRFADRRRDSTRVVRVASFYGYRPTLVSFSAAASRRTSLGMIHMVPGHPQLPTIGILGGIAPESTIFYYRTLVSRYRRRFDGSYPRVIINSIDLEYVVRLVAAGDHEQLAAHVLAELQRLNSAGAAIAIFASHLPHLVFDELSAVSPIPLISIVEAARARAAAIGARRVALLGTRFTMEAPFYPRVFSRAGIAVVVPSWEEQDWIHRIYMNELVESIFSNDTRARLLELIENLICRHSVDAVVLGGTELPLLLTQAEHHGVPLLNTGEIHVDALLSAVAESG